MSGGGNRFFIVGAQRSGTTYLYRILDEHPEIEMSHPARPEPKFFLLDELFSKGLPHYEKTYFGRKPGARTFGEKTTSYCESEAAARRIHASYPDARIIWILRDPVDRAVSNYVFSRNFGIETLDMEEAFRSESGRRDDFDRSRFSMSPFAYLQRGEYLPYLKRYEALFPAERTRILLHEELMGNREAISALYGWLGADPGFSPPSLSERINAEERADVSLSPSLEAYLRDHFREPNRELARHTGLDLSAWKS